MNGYRERRGQRIGQWVVESFYGRTPRGKALWVLRHDATGETIIKRTDKLKKMAMRAGSPAPPVVGGHPQMPGGEEVKGAA